MVVSAPVLAPQSGFHMSPGCVEETRCAPLSNVLNLLVRVSRAVAKSQCWQARWFDSAAAIDAQMTLAVASSLSISPHKRVRPVQHRLLPTRFFSAERQIKGSVMT